MEIKLQEAISIQLPSSSSSSLFLRLLTSMSKLTNSRLWANEALCFWHKVFWQSDTTFAYFCYFKIVRSIMQSVNRALCIYLLFKKSVLACSSRFGCAALLAATAERWREESEKKRPERFSNERLLSRRLLLPYSRAEQNRADKSQAQSSPAPHTSATCDLVDAVRTGWAIPLRRDIVRLFAKR